MKTEILAPAGNIKAFMAAMRAGADAIYIGGKNFGARKMAANFSREEMEKAVRLAHLAGKSVYVTVNTLISDGEMDILKEYLYFLSKIKVDAVIVQDFGVVNLMREILPSLELHASTQMTIHNVEGLKFCIEQGISRVTLSRELSIFEIEKITKEAKKIGLEVEVFIHGALCISFSGQCLMSSLIGGRSGNRGACAQPCRLPYFLVNEKGQEVLKQDEMGSYLLSPKDLQGIELLEKLIEIGVDSFKIEGRMKKEEYVYTVVLAYKQMLNYIQQKDKMDKSEKKPKMAKLEQNLKDVAQVFNRGFTHAYLDKKINLDMMSMKRPNNRGVLVGRLESFDKRKNTINVLCSEKIVIGDALECWIKVGGRVILKVDNLLVNGEVREVVCKGEIATITLKEKAFFSVGDRVFRTFSQEIAEKTLPACDLIEESNNGFICTKILAQAFLGKPLVVNIKDDEGNEGIGQSDKKIEKSKTKILNEVQLKEQLAKMGKTLFCAEEIECVIDAEFFLPFSEINLARRRAIFDLEEKRILKWQNIKKKCSKEFVKNYSLIKIEEKEKTKLGKEKINKKTNLTVTVDTISKARIALENGADNIVFAGETLGGELPSVDEILQFAEDAEVKGKKTAIVLPRITFSWQMAMLKKRIEGLTEGKVKALIVGQAGFLALAREMRKKNTSLELWGDWSLNIFNHKACDFFAKEGLCKLTLSLEMTMEQIENIIKFQKERTELECVVHGYMPMMISEYCMLGAVLGYGKEKHSLKFKERDVCNKPCKKEKFYLKDRKGICFPIFGDSFCRMQIFNAVELSMLDYVKRLQEVGINNLRIEGSCATKDEVALWTKMYSNTINCKFNENIYNKEKKITRGHYFRGTIS